ncbi:hypothetical protein [Streptomyces sp. NBC_00576]|uniref:hypothetical protein n=1 Tax=Streptomyces sp. NBC_00576 TaxID=2903665 RepID=UPI002E81C80E|nr:hypothetical protein [Streptomyces sp. NBC_00576]WUB76972.1 hypothetical protein OG734_46945 [Streptomyces sp. NBC_00576]
MHSPYDSPAAAWRLSQRLTMALASVIAPRLAPESGRVFTKAGDSYTPAGGDIVVAEVVAGTTRHAVITVVRLHLRAVR